MDNRIVFYCLEIRSLFTRYLGYSNSKEELQDYLIKLGWIRITEKMRRDNKNLRDYHYMYGAGKKFGYIVQVTVTYKQPNYEVEDQGKCVQFQRRRI